MTKEEYTRFVSRCGEFKKTRPGFREETMQRNALRIFCMFDTLIDHYELMMIEGEDRREEFSVLITDIIVEIGALLSDNVKRIGNAHKFFSAERDNFNAFAKIRTPDIVQAMFTASRMIVDAKFSAFNTQHLAEAHAQLFGMADSLNIPVEARAMAMFK